MTQTLRISLIVLVLALIVAIPPYATGIQALNNAEIALKNAHPMEATTHFVRAIRLMPWRMDLWQRAGLAALMANDAGLAISYFEIAQDHGELGEPARYALGDALWQLGKQDAARAQWESMRSQGIQNAIMLDRLAGMYESEGNFDAAIDARRAQLALDAGDANARYRLGVMLASQADPAALNELIRAAQDDPTLESRVQSVRAALNVALLNVDPAYQLVATGRGLGEADEWVLAQVAFINAVDLNGNYAEAWAWLGEARQQLGFDDGGQYIDYAYRLDPQSVMVLVLYGLHHQRIGEAVIAIRAFEVVAEFEPDNPLWVVTLASMQANNGQLQDALESYQRAIEMRPDDSTYYKLLAAFCADYQYDVLEVGARAAVKARNLAPNDPEVRVIQARLMLLSDYESAAVKLLDQAFALDPENAAANYYRGFIYFNNNEMTLAKEYLNKALANDPDGTSGALARNILERYFP